MATRHSLPPTADLLQRAFDQHVDAMKSLPEAEVLTRVNFDVATAVATVLGAHPTLLTLRDEIHAMCPKTSLRMIDELDTLAHAALHAHIRSLTAPPSEDRLAKLSDEARALRKRLLADAQAAAGHDLVSAEAVDLVPRGAGRLEVAQALVAISVLFRASWSKVRGSTAVTDDDLTDAAQRGVELLTLLGADDNPAAAQRSTPERALRLRAITLLYRAWDECRRAVTYVRWHHDDAAEYTPSLMGPRSRRGGEAPDAPDPVTPEPAPPAPGDKTPR